MPRSLTRFIGALALGATSFGCAPPSDVCAGEADCTPKSPCAGLTYACSDGWVATRTVVGEADRSDGAPALAARGDLLLENDRVRVVLDALDSPHYLSPTGGAVLDFAPQGGADSLRSMFQAVGILPGDAFHYSTVQVIDDRPRRVSAIYRGTLDGHPDIDVVTRYELRPCEPGLRMRTEVYHGGIDPLTVFLADGSFWGDRGLTPFVPHSGGGYTHPDLDLANLGAAFWDVPYLAADAHAPTGSAYALLRCDAESLNGFQSETASALGPSRVLLMPGDSLSYERFFTVAPAPGLSGAVDEALDARSQLFGDTLATVSGRVQSRSGGALGGDERKAALLFYSPAAGADPDRASGRTPWTETIPNDRGEFSVRLPFGQRLRVEAVTLGRAVAHADVVTDHTSVALDPIVLDDPSTLSAHVHDAGGKPLIAEIVVMPATDADRTQGHGSVFGVFDNPRCSPFLGPTHGPSPACNRALVEPSGSVQLDLPPGHFDVYATRGPFWSVAHASIDVTAGQSLPLDFELADLGLLPAGVLSADFHVHAGASFDSSFPERDRALSFIASGVDVIAATDHNVITDYRTTLDGLGLGDQIAVIPGEETTGHILFLRPPGTTIPEVVGHFNFWPMPYQPNRPRNGAPDDQRLEPGALFDRMKGLSKSAMIAQLNHPYADTTFGRDQGYMTAISYDPRVAIPNAPDDTAAGQLARRPAGGFRNLDYDVEEVMNGHEVRRFMQYRELWFSLLNQGILRAGTANSDTHTHAVEVLGYPRNLVVTDQSPATFDPIAFDASVKSGHMVGTNGPVLYRACVKTAIGCTGPSLEPLRAGPNDVLDLDVRAAPWIPVDEIRFIVNGKLVKRVALDPVMPDNPFATTAPAPRYQGQIRLGDLLGAAPTRDSWLVVEAGMRLPVAADLDDDGIVDTTDNDGNGVVDSADGEFCEPQGRFVEDPVCARYQDSHRFVLDAIAPGVLPAAFTNPFLIDVDGDGWTAPGLRP